MQNHLLSPKKTFYKPVGANRTSDSAYSFISVNINTTICS